MNERVLHNEVKKLDAAGNRQLAESLLQQVADEAGVSVSTVSASTVEKPLVEAIA